MRGLTLKVLNRLLARDGLLIIGHADRLSTGGTEPGFRPVGNPRSFAYSREPARPQPGPQMAMEGGPAPSPCALPRPLTPLAGGQPVHPVPPPAAARSLLPIVTRDPRGLPPPGSGQENGPAAPRLRPTLEQAAELANLGRHPEAIAVCEQFVRQNGPVAAAYGLMGVIHQSRGDRAQAETCFLKAVYLDPRHEDALLALALCAERRGDAAMAKAYRRRAERAMLNKGAR